MYEPPSNAALTTKQIVLTLPKRNWPFLQDWMNEPSAVLSNGSKRLVVLPCRLPLRKMLSVDLSSGTVTR
jgi:hypothetical protein